MKSGSNVDKRNKRFIIVYSEKSVLRSYDN